MYQDYKDLLSAFHAHGVRYLIVGGYAVIYHSQPRFTKDIDIFIKADSLLVGNVTAAQHLRPGWGRRRVSSTSLRQIEAEPAI